LQTKVIAVGPVWNAYFYLWSGPSSELCKRSFDVDTKILNLGMLAHFLNTFPQFFVQGKKKREEERPHFKAHTH